jgi:flagellar biosynthesis/type III secretory pathway M-ring protein FliF/YscJ
MDAERAGLRRQTKSAIANHQSAMSEAKEGPAMDALKAQLLRIQQQLGSLSASQRMLTMSLVAIMVMTMVWWARYAGTAEMEPLLDQPMAQEEISRIKNALAAKGIRYTVTGDRILVAADKRFEALADLSYAQLLPENTVSGFDEMAAKLTPFDPQSKTDSYMNRGRELTLMKVIQAYPGVAGANVSIDPSKQQRIGRSIEPTAAVSVRMKSGVTPTADLVNAIASQVSGSVAGMKRSKVNVVINGRAYPVRDAENSAAASSAEHMEQLAQFERGYQLKIEDFFKTIPGLTAAVVGQLDTTAATTRTLRYDKPNSLSMPRSEETENEENSSGPKGSDPGAKPNMPLDVSQPPVAATGNSNTRERTRTENDNFPGMQEENRTQLAGTPKVKSAAVQVPLSYFINEWKRRNPAATSAPDDAALQPIIDARSKEIGDQVVKITGVAGISDVSVMCYPDDIPAAVPDASVASAGGQMAGMLGGNVKEIAVGALAVVSLFMVSMMVRKGNAAAPPPPPSAAVVADANALHPGEDVAGEVGEGLTTLLGQEVDDESLEARQMVDQVSTMVKENPDAAAQLVKRWLSRS